MSPGGRRWSVVDPQEASHPGSPWQRPARHEKGHSVVAREEAGPILNGIPSQLPDIDPEETAGVAGRRSTASSTSGGRTAPATSCSRCWSGPASASVGVPSLTATDYINTIPPEDEPWFPGDEEIERRYRALDPLERRDHGAPRAAPRHRRRRPHLDLRLVGHAVRGRLQPLLPRQGPPGRRRPGLLPGPRLPRHLRPRLPRGPPERGPARRLPPGAVARRPAAGLPVLPAPAADAGLLGVPDRLDGPRPDERDLPGAVQQVPARTAASRTPRDQHVWAFLGDGEMDEPESPRRCCSSPPTRSSTTSPSSSTATCSASTARSAATARSSRSSRRSSAAPAGTSSR